jgi:hypothetical protein
LFQVLPLNTWMLMVCTTTGTDDVRMPTAAATLPVLPPCQPAAFFLEPCVLDASSRIACSFCVVVVFASAQWCYLNGKVYSHRVFALQPHLNPGSVSLFGRGVAWNM